VFPGSSIVCLERFYPMRGLKVHAYAKRGTNSWSSLQISSKNTVDVPLDPRRLSKAPQVPGSFRAGDGLLQVMTDSLIRGRPRSELTLCYHSSYSLTSKPKASKSLNQPQGKCANHSPESCGEVWTKTVSGTFLFSASYVRKLGSGKG
jgi:hypothetical protein